MHDDFHLDLHADQRLRLAKEMYLKAILQLGKDGPVKPVDLVHCLGVTKGSVSEMLKKLAEEKFIEYESFRSIKLTPKGRKKANLILRKYHIVRQFLEKTLKMKGPAVHDDACNLEHAFSDTAIEKLERFLHKK
ncbi:MAG: metal-dependent transcriptional regulator [Candidatus Woesearchaeota archaeon]|nr:metal-dependent transcriptional regulator [Candidatus Woesearchaeota archaeon]